VADHPLRPATDHRLGRPLPHQPANPTRAPPVAINLSRMPLSRHPAYAVLAEVSLGYPPQQGRFPRATHPCATPRRTEARQSVRLACVKHAASVRSEPGSNSHVQSQQARHPQDLHPANSRPVVTRPRPRTEPRPKRATKRSRKMPALHHMTRATQQKAAPRRADSNPHAAARASLHSPTMSISKIAPAGALRSPRHSEPSGSGPPGAARPVRRGRNLVRAPAPVQRLDDKK
jgi:hypothetical protein